MLEKRDHEKVKGVLFEGESICQKKREIGKG